MEMTMLENTNSATNRMTAEIRGTGKWLEDGEIFEIHSIKGPLATDDTVVNVHSKTRPGTIEAKKYEAKKILFFVSEVVKH